MSFEVFVRCNCEKKKLMNIPPFIDKLELILGEFIPKSEYKEDKNLEKDYASWKFCEHDQFVINYSIAGVLVWRTNIQKKYGDEFENFRNFLPESNNWVGKDYDKIKAIEEIRKYNKLEIGKYEYRINQFLNLLEKAIEMDEEIYWI